VSLRMREIGQEDFSHYLRHINDGVEGRVEWSILVDRLVVKETSFFRHQPSLNFVCAHLQDKINNNSLNGSYDVWSLGCSTGEEPYSLAILINESFELARREPFFGITATDISRVAISIGKAGLYSERKLEFIPSAFRYKYFSEAGNGKYRFDHECSEKVCFSCANVMQLGDMPKMQFDVIYCQNMLVYFRRDLRRHLMDQLAQRLKPGGILVVGLGEIVNWSNPAVYRVSEAQVQAYERRING